jgi:endoglucanase
MEKKNSLTKLYIALSLAFCLTVFANYSFGQKLQINDSGYFEKPGVNVFVFSGQYSPIFFDEKTAGIEIIHHGVRTATGGAVRLQNTPEQWDLIPVMSNRKVDKAANTVTANMTYKEFDFGLKTVVTAKDAGVEISVYLDKPLPKELEGHAGFNMEFLPAVYFEKSYLADGKPGNFPLYPTSNTQLVPVSKKIRQYGSYATADDRGTGQFVAASPFASGKTMVLAPEDLVNRIKIQCADAVISMYDGRNLGQNGWFNARSLLPANKTGKVLTWYLEPSAIPNWKRKPVIGFSQVGYNLNQEKVAVVELDKTDAPLATASLMQLTADGKAVEKLKRAIKPWGRYLRYNYVKFDFSSVKDPGLYYIQYGTEKTNTFSINNGVYSDIWHPTLDVWFPVQMDHMMVNEAYRVWHGAPFLDDALQAPTNFTHFDNYKMGPSTQTKYKPLERIPGMAVGGWFDAGDFDIETGSHCNAVASLADTWNNFKLNRDETYVDYPTRYVDIHRPDGKPDLLQQVEHGTLALVAQMKNIGHPIRGIIVPNLHQYHHLGDASTETDNKLYDSTLKRFEVNGQRSGTMDDRWAFTEHTPFLDYSASASLAAASRALKGYNDTLSQQCLMYAKQLWDDNEKNPDTSRAAARFGRNAKAAPALQLYIATKDDKYASAFKEAIWQTLDRNVAAGIKQALQAYPYMDEAYKNKLRDYVVKLKVVCDDYAKQNPYGVPISLGGWGGSGGVVSFATTNYYANKYFPDIITPEYVYRGLNYIFGCHPYHNVSFVSSVGTVSKKITYGNNRADFRFIAGGLVPGILVLKPDFPENKEDWPFFWGENEVTISGCGDYVFLAAAAGQLAASR